MQQNENYEPLNIACVFSPPAEGNKDIQQIQEDLPQEQNDNCKEPEEKKKALKLLLTTITGNIKPTIQSLSLMPTTKMCKNASKINNIAIKTIHTK